MPRTPVLLEPCAIFVGEALSAHKIPNGHSGHRLDVVPITHLIKPDQNQGDADFSDETDRSVTGTAPLATSPDDLW